MPPPSSEAGDDDGSPPPSPALSPRGTSSTPSLPAPSADVDLTDEVQDFRFLTSLIDSETAQKLPSRGTKDFEPHGTRAQDAALAASRAAMHAALSLARVHPRGGQRAEWDGKDGAWVDKPGGFWVRSVGRVVRVPIADSDSDSDSEDQPSDTMPTKPKSPRKPKTEARTHLHPEEALWLLERGSLDIHWPPAPGEAPFTGLPMSLQGGYAAFLGEVLSLEVFTVYQYLKRAGYTVLRAGENEGSVPVYKAAAGNPLSVLFARLWTALFAPQPAHDPTTNTSIGPAPTDPTAPRVTYHVYKPLPGFKKTSPGPPDFYVSVINARESCFPSERQLDGLLAQTPYHPPTGVTNLYLRLKKGYRDVVLAVVDQGVAWSMAIWTS
ncbi:hypothetical protein EJ06DRAFT_548264 [Trichodelitschia bisporula]|uniref:tRNA-splicing endonuclease subunit Sen54 N-terminal domain-containing protein n=1 Tax=Trichodelitschia bisporula TaxID=703511 RepID=A0A6G1HZ33_9PEZI|nr:hypothetical protein EJ06DRAFT_548264 [Trichodelitschia bisporula]